MSARYTPGERKASIPTRVAEAEPVTAELLLLLKQETQKAHLDIERSARFLDNDAGEAEYADYLARQLGFYEPMEARLCAICAAAGAVRLDMEHRRKAQLIAQDLSALGHTAAELAQLPRCPASELPPLSGLQEALGCLYVFEGATLGGRYVHHHLSQRLPAIVERAGGFLRGYGPDTRSRWLEFGQALALYAQGPRTIVRSAQATFLALHKWLLAGQARGLSKAATG